ncbi:MAG: hypothetical protein K0Q94_4860 [Paenibacillus sp.]|nr:hypothetical protein [Paenibacillus sp.]
MNRNGDERNESALEGNELTKEQLSDVYTSVTSDGIHKLSSGSVTVSDEPVPSGSVKRGAAESAETSPLPRTAASNGVTGRVCL